MKVKNRMKYKILLLLMLSLGLGLKAQPTISPSLVSSGGNAGDYVSPTFHVSWSVGEPCITTVTAGNTTITQGFHQPLGKVQFRIDTILRQNSRCKTANNGWAKVVVKGGSGHFGYEWSPVSSAKDSVGGLAEGAYRVIVTDSLTGDTASKWVSIKLDFDGECDLKFYSGYSPNGDGINDKWIIDGIDLFPKNNVKIFNRYGTIVYEVNDYNNTTTVWEGQYQKTGEQLPDGTYYYIVVLTDKKTDNVYKGWVEITR